MNREELLKNAKPILFNTEMVQAILEGRKTVTRRAVKPQPIAGIRKSVFVPSGIEDEHGKEIKLLYKVGDIRYVRETFNCITFGNGKTVPFKTEYWYKADDTINNPDEKWRPSIYMPKAAARIFLKVTNVKVERLQDMTQEDCIKEGCGELSEEQFAEFWNSLLPKYYYDWMSWQGNPYVWVIEFERGEVENE